MPNKVEKLPDGKMHIELETGEVFDGDPLEVTQKMADAHVNTKRWGQEWKQKAEGSSNHQQPPVTQQPAAVDPQQAQLQSYLGDQIAQWAGYKDGNEFLGVLKRVNKTTEEVNNQLVASAFLAQAPDFPNTKESIDAISKKIDEMGWGFDTQSMIAAHALLVREHASDATKGYAPLTAEQQNAQWEAGLRASNRPTPPPVISGSSPDASQQGFNPWDQKSVPLDQLRAAAIRQQLEGKQ